MWKICQPKQAIKRLVLSSVLILSFVCAVSAYTVVMRGGKRIEIPSKFLVTTTTLTYEAGPGIQITLQLAAIDITATEKANNETAGALLRRVGAANEESTAQNRGEVEKTKASRVRRTITNRDLEASTVRRRQSELAYEKRRKELGLPSVAESRRRAEVESVQIRNELAATRSSEKESESYWRARASALRTEIAAIDAELNYLRVRLEDSPFPLSSGFTSISVAPFITSGISFGNAVIGGPFTGAAVPHPFPVFGAPQFGTHLQARLGFGGGDTRGRVLLNNGGFRHSRSLGFGFPFPVVSSVGVFGAGIQSYDFSYERSALITHFNELATARAGLNARWRELEDEARRAGAPPGWLRTQ
ncbi:MAG TPA: hypothetical protein VN951_13020 [Pyrinomonadaceae bacterium]|nr:hypothetical protein [Pyrinomonadaceae bacterium]